MKNNIPNYNEIIFTDEVLYEIIDDYCNKKMTTKQIGEKYGCSYKTIARKLQLKGIKLVGNGKRKYYFNEHYLDCINTEDKAYILGFLYADGCNFPPKQTVSISLQECDKYILEYMREQFETSKELEYIDYSDKHDFGYDYVNQYRLPLFSKHLCDTLSNIGMIRNKSHNMQFPTCIPDELIKYFILGYYDGDGGLTVKRKESHTKYDIHLSITSTFDFCYDLKSILEEKLSLTSIKINEATNHNGVTAALYIMKKEEKLKFLKWLYEDAEHYLTRKYDKYILCLSHENIAA